MARAKLDPQTNREVSELTKLLRRELPGADVDHRGLAIRLHTAGVRIFPVLQLTRLVS